jgi:hypothetical protein
MVNLDSEATEDKDSTTKHLLSMYEVTAPAMLDKDTVFWSCVLQASVTGFALLLCSLFHVDVLRRVAFRFDDVKIVTLFTSTLLGKIFTLSLAFEHLKGLRLI